MRGLPGIRKFVVHDLEAMQVGNEVLFFKFVFVLTVAAETIKDSRDWERELK